MDQLTKKIVFSNEKPISEGYKEITFNLPVKREDFPSIAVKYVSEDFGAPKFDEYFAKFDAGKFLEAKRTIDGVDSNLTLVEMVNSVQKEVGLNLRNCDIGESRFYFKQLYEVKP